jgi:hypothetical protein
MRTMSCANWVESKYPRERSAVFPLHVPKERHEHPRLPREGRLTMGSLYYGDTQTPIQIEDRALAHLKVVIATKLRRNESFTLSWRHPEGDAPGRSTLWLHPSIPLRFVFDEAETPELSRRWIEELAHSANSSGGITLVEEHLEGADVV